MISSKWPSGESRHCPEVNSPVGRVVPDEETPVLHTGDVAPTWPAVTAKVGTRSPPVPTIAATTPTSACRQHRRPDLSPVHPIPGLLPVEWKYPSRLLERF